MLAAALRRRFAHIQDSPDRDRECDESPGSQPPERPYSHVQHHHQPAPRPPQLRHLEPERHQPAAGATPLVSGSAGGGGALSIQCKLSTCWTGVFVGLTFLVL